MKTEDSDLLEYDEDEAVRFIRDQLPQELKETFSDDEINYIIDLMYEFYDVKGYLNDEEQEVDVDLDELTAFVIKNAKKDKVGSFSEDAIQFVIDGEIAYCESIGIFD
jgi:hypothetical protein